MSEVTSDNFGLLIAYLIPGFAVIVGLSPYSPTMDQWLGSTPAEAPTVGGFLYVTLASVAAGMGVSALRWLVLDTIHHRTGVPRPDWNFAELQSHLSAFDALANQHYRYYQFYANSLMAMAISAVPVFSQIMVGTGQRLLFAGGAGLIAMLFFVASRDALAKYYGRTSALLRRQ